MTLSLISQAVVGGMPSPATRRANAKRINDYLAWTGNALPSRWSVQAWVLTALSRLVWWIPWHDSLNSLGNSGERLALLNKSPPESLPGNVTDTT